MDVTSQAIEQYKGFLTKHSVNPLPAAKVVREEPDSSSKLPVVEIDAVNFSKTFFSNTAEAVSALENVIDAFFDRSDTPALPDKVYAEFALTGHGETDANTAGELTGHSGGMLNEKGIVFAKEQKKDVKKRPHIIVSSDLPRAIHHALIKFAKLDDIDETILKETGEKVNAKKRPDKADYCKLVDLALNQGIVPTPLARAQYYGILELYPEKFEMDYGAEKPYTAKNLDDFAKKFKELKESGSLRKINPAVNDFVESFLSESSDKEMLSKLYKLALGRKDATVFRGKNYLPEDENRLLFYHRMGGLFSIFEKMKDKLKDRQVEIVAHSGFVDVALRYFGHKSNLEGFQLANRDKGKIRGETVLVKVNEKFEYLNDPLLLSKIRNHSGEVASRQRKASLDEGIKSKKNTVIPVELLGFKNEKGKEYKSFSVSLDDILKSDKSVLLLGNFGQGKSTAAVELAEMLNSDEKYNKKYVPVFLTARDINFLLPNKLGADKSKNNAEVLDLLSQGVTKLPIALTKEFTPVLIIDALDELSLDIREIVSYGIHELLPKECKHAKVIATSRFTGFDTYENEGFNTFHVDPTAVIRNLDTYLSGRIIGDDGNPDKQRFEKFKEFLTKQDDVVKNNYLLVYFLANLYNNKDEKLGDLNKPLSEGEILLSGIEHALWDHKVPKGKITGEKKPFGEANTVQPADSYKEDRKKSLKEWMGFLKKVAAYMHIKNTSTISREELEELQGDWSISKYLSKLKGE